MPASEIDDIFASKGQGVPATPTPSSSVPPKKKKKDRGAKRKREPEPEDDAPSKPPAKRPAPETVLDPSVRPAAAAPRPPKALAAASKKRPKAGREDEERFKDSRGAGSRRTTEEGWAVYKEDELGITDQGGDTPLCPFDCQCCE
ncbi:hypothetical protein OBBRIDRAFT_809026 [Obba rivulosa]|uniref:DUF1764-domain-containing protein n=1 Tax=Obba rivulosa TaxID=1052685 RepID=A0A8E2J8B0_9APHY|nr:hypothetical protein OBBRIDRAFT_809026 [Obba rivulosa]